MIEQMLRSTNIDDVVLALITSPEECIAVMEKWPDNGYYSSGLGLGRNYVSPMKIIINNSRMFVILPEYFIGVVNPKKYNYFKSYDIRYTDNSIIW